MSVRLQRSNRHVPMCIFTIHTLNTLNVKLIVTHNPHFSWTVSSATVSRWLWSFGSGKNPLPVCCPGKAAAAGGSVSSCPDRRWTATWRRRTSVAETHRMYETKSRTMSVRSWSPFLTLNPCSDDVGADSFLELFCCTSLSIWHFDWWTEQWCRWKTSVAFVLSQQVNKQRAANTHRVFTAEQRDRLSSQQLAVIKEETRTVCVNTLSRLTLRATGFGPDPITCSLLRSIMNTTQSWNQSLTLLHVQRRRIKSICLCSV